MEIKKYYNGKDEISADYELTIRAKAYMKEHKTNDYSKASNAVLAADPELAKAYAVEDLTDYESPEPEKNFVPAKPRKMSRYEMSLAASAELAEDAEIIMLEHNIDYLAAFKLACKRKPHKEREYCLEIID